MSDKTLGIPPYIRGSMPDSFGLPPRVDAAAPDESELVFREPLLPDTSNLYGIEMTQLVTNLVECGAITSTPERPMAKQPQKKPKPKAVELSAQQLVTLLIDEAGETRSSIAERTGIDRSAVRRIHLGEREAIESSYRKLAEMAIYLKIAE